MKKRTGIFICTLLVLLLGSCNNGVGYHSIYGDDEAIAGNDRYNIGTFAGEYGENGEYYITTSSQTGAITVWQYQAGALEEEIAVNCWLAVDSGNVKVVLVAPDDSVLLILEATAAGEVPAAGYSFSTAPGTYRLKIVATHWASYTCTLEANKGSLMVA